ncbi:MAG: glycosyltransferase family 2 protein [bacterium]|nr:glycosyltransferase family 2 protein [bacterium]
MLEQDYEPFEIIVVDGQSIDSTAQIAQTFPKVRYIRQFGQGLWDAYNLGIKAARGEFIGFLAYDDLWTPHKLRLQVEYLTRHPEYHYIIGTINFFWSQDVQYR